MMVSGVGTKSYFHQNHLYSVAAITDGAGTVVERYRYDAFGKRTVTNAAGTPIAASTVGNQVGLTGKYLDAETGLYDFEARAYSPTLGRFLARDPWRSTRKDLNLIYRPYGHDGYQDGYGLYTAYFMPNQVDPTGEAPGCNWSDCDSGNICILGGGHGPMTGVCTWTTNLWGNRNCGCKANPNNALLKKVLVVCGCGVVVVGAVVVGCMLPPAAPLAGKAACAALGAAVLSIQLTDDPSCQSQSCGPSGCPTP